MYCVYGNSGWYIHGGPLFGGGPLLGGFVIRGSTVCHAYQLSSFLLDYQTNMVDQRNPDLGLVQQQILYGMVQKHFKLWLLIYTKLW